MGAYKPSASNNTELGYALVFSLQVRYEGDFEGAMVQFSSPSEAKKAHDCTEAILNNRFVRVYYLRKDELFPPPLPLPPFMDYSLEVGACCVLSRCTVLIDWVIAGPRFCVLHPPQRPFSFVHGYL